MKILISGSNGFLGNIIKQKLGGNLLSTLGRKNTDFNLFLDQTIPNFNSQFDLVIHAAGKAHSIPKTEKEIQEYFNVNVLGTKNLLKGLEKHPPKKFVFISSVAVYGLNYGNLINEDHPLLAKDPYGKSKIEAELIVDEWCIKNQVKCTILRLPLLVGPNAPGNLFSMVKGIKKGYYFNIAGGKAKKSMVLAEDVANHLLKVSEIGGIYNLTDGYHPSFEELSLVIAKNLGKKSVRNIPIFVAKFLAFFGNILGEKIPINSKKLMKITSNLTFDDTKAREAFDWNPTPVLKGKIIS